MYNSFFWRLKIFKAYFLMCFNSVLQAQEETPISFYRFFQPGSHWKAAEPANQLQMTSFTTPLPFLPIKCTQSR